MPPLGYDVENRKLAIKVAEARTVVDPGAISRSDPCTCFGTSLREPASRQRRTRPDGTEYGGQWLSRGEPRWKTMK